VSGRPLPDISAMSVSEVSAYVSGLDLPRPHRARPEDIEWLDLLAGVLAADGRAGVRRLGERVRRTVEGCRNERRRAARLLEAEIALCPPDAVAVAGIDEAGRGPLAGPVVAAAVILRPGAVVPGLDDSKRLPEDVREEVYQQVRRASLSIGVGVAGTGLVERLNIAQASFEAMRRAVARLGVPPDYLLVDGFRIPELDLPQRGVIGGDALCASIAAASVVAKVTRDAIMRRVAGRFPAYGFERNKGYGTPEHWAALRRQGPCPAHRRTFLGRLLAGEPEAAGG